MLMMVHGDWSPLLMLMVIMMLIFTTISRGLGAISVPPSLTATVAIMAVIILLICKLHRPLLTRGVSSRVICHDQLCQPDGIMILVATLTLTPLEVEIGKQMMPRRLLLQARPLGSGSAPPPSQLQILLIDVQGIP